MQVELLTDGELATRLLQLARDCVSMEWAVAWAQPNDVGHSAIRHARKFRHLVIGTHFYQTSPEFLKRFEGLGAARMVLPTGATFHPKVYLFRLGGGMVAASIGSHNLTRAAFTRNTEASVLLMGDERDPTLVGLQEFVEAQWRRADSIKDNLFAYSVQHAANEQRCKALASFRKGIVRPFGNVSPLEWNWSEFVRHIRAARGLDLRRRLRVLDGAQRLFESKGALARMEPLERKAVTGTFHKLERRPDDVDWAWFGSMVGHGDFKHLVNQRPAQLSAALDEIPFDGDVGEDQYRRYVVRFRRAFNARSHGGRYPTATRMLAMKRPDWFVAVNRPNVRGLCAAFGMGHTTLSLETYWDRIVVPVTLTSWWQAPAPLHGIPRQIWNGRAALLDTIFYDPA